MKRTKRFKLGPRRGSFDCVPAGPNSVHKDVRDRVLHRAEIVCDARGIRMPHIDVMHCSHIEGMKGYLNLENTIFLDLGKLDAEDAYERTFAHEVSHAIVRNLSSFGEPYHGPTWKRVMQAMGQVVPERYDDSDYDKKKENSRYRDPELIRGE